MNLTPSQARILVFSLSGALILALAAIAWLLLKPVSSGGFETRTLIPSSMSSEGTQLLFSVDGKKVFRELLDSEFELTLSMAQIPPEMAARVRADITHKQRALESLQAQFVVLLEAQQRGVFTNSEFRTLLRKVVRETSFQYATMDLAGKDLVVTDDDVANYYNQNKNQFPGGFDSQAEIELRKLLKQAKMQEVMMKKIADFKTRHPVTVNDAVDLYGIKSGR